MFLIRILTDAGEMDFTSIAEGIGDTFRKALSGTFANIIMAPVNTALSQIAAGVTGGPPGVGRTAGRGAAGMAGGGGGGFSGISASWAQMSQGQQYGTAVGLGGTGGYVAGSVYSQAAGLKPGNQAALGGAVGGALGAGVGLYFGGPVGAMVGGTVGAAAGSAIGGMIGGENNLGNDRSAQVFAARRQRAVYSDVSFSPENRQVTQGIISDLRVVVESLDRSRRHL